MNYTGLKTIRVIVTLFIFGLVLSGITAIPLVAKIDALVRLTSADAAMTSTWAGWLLKIQTALHQTAAEHPMLFYGTDWLAFGHIVIAVAFIGAWKDPVKNEWLFNFGLIACAMVIPWAFIFGVIRETPVWWRLIDCSFGVVGAIPLWWCRSMVKNHKRATAI